MMVWVESTCFNINAKSPEGCVYVYAEKVRSGWVTKIENTCKRKVSIEIGDTIFNLGAISPDGAHNKNEANGYILTNLNKSQAKFMD